VELTGRVAIVTGAAAGIGRASARALAGAGVAAVAVVDVDAEGGEQTAELVRGDGADSTFFRVDVADLDALRGLFAEVAGRFGAPTVVHNNAGLVAGQPPWPDMAPERIVQMVSVNLTGVMVGTRLAIDSMRAVGGGAVVNTASAAALGPLTDDPVYAGTKAGVVLFTQSCKNLRDELGIRVNAVLPGMVDTPMLAKTGEGGRPAPWVESSLDLLVIMPPERIAEEVVALARDDTKAGETVLVMNDLAGGA
jgi:NAD(P)-dependent dehydrogenase (short-subunit alcohol dehydrogenase family)